VDVREVIVCERKGQPFFVRMIFKAMKWNHYVKWNLGSL
jgi:hypothetical protein